MALTDTDGLRSAITLGPVTYLGY
ncbi:uncharacterized protein G2W53_023528 [Senna tora]|uniref:Uncharacterized protein n=1 Tax=Senna tora TaxID=362788 RepID=A0A834WEK4_9FABA|nr:uncharacterized protein G2W53_023528 [Senna tora]